MNFAIFFNIFIYYFISVEIELNAVLPCKIINLGPIESCLNYIFRHTKEFKDQNIVEPWNKNRATLRKKELFA